MQLVRISFKKMKLFIVLSLFIAYVLSASTGSSRSNALMKSTFGAENLSLLDMAALLDHSEQIAPLIQKGANASARSGHDHTPLHYAAIYCSSENAARLLIENGADVNAKIINTELTPLHIAYITGRPNTVNLLINNGADQNALDWSGKKPKDYENDINRTQIFFNIDPFRRDMKQRFEERYNQIIKELGM